MKEKNKIIIIALLILIIASTFSVMNVQAFGNSIYYDSGGNSNGNNNNDNDNKGCPTNVNLTYSKTIFSPWFRTSKTGFNGKFYDKNDKVILDDETKTLYPTLSGTSIGMDFYEETQYTWGVSCTQEYTYVTTSKECLSYSKEFVCRGREWITDFGMKMCNGKLYHPCEKYKTNTNTCYKATSCTPKMISNAYNQIKKSISNTKTNYNASIGDPNDINSTKRYTLIAVDSYNETASNPMPNPIIKRTRYEMYGACINVKTAKVRYLTSSSEKCNEDEIKIENSTSDFYTHHWHFFIPLNAKSNDKYSFLATSKEKKSLNECKRWIELRENEYKYYIAADIEGKKFTGNKYTDLKTITKNNGCYMNISIDITLSQKFYNEEQSDDKTIFKGFAFYYRPININNPFPNGIASDSLWKEWESSNKKDPDLTKSFSSITYFATNINANSVRTYNKEHPYTSWSEMNLNGTSSYINSSSIIKRNNVSTKSFYNLGCGPSNKDWEECR